MQKASSTAVEVGVPKLGNCLEMYTCPSPCPICAQHVYKLGHSLYTGATAWPPLVHWSCIHACAQAWAHVYISKQFPSLGTPTFTAVLVKASLRLQAAEKPQWPRLYSSGRPRSCDRMPSLVGDRSPVLRVLGWALTRMRKYR